MSQQARSILDLSVQASGAIAYGRAVNVIAPAIASAITGAQATVAGQKVIGIARRDAASGAYTDVTCLGTAVCEAGAAITVGSRVQCDASGRVITATALSAAQGAIGIGTLAVAAGATAVTSTAANGAILTGAPTVANPTLAGGDPPVYVFGTALQAASAAGDFIEVLICP
jgi:hypothetical protein